MSDPVRRHQAVGNKFKILFAYFYYTVSVNVKLVVVVFVSLSVGKGAGIIVKHYPGCFPVLRICFELLIRVEITCHVKVFELLLG